jgi:hypothetical protein
MSWKDILKQSDDPLNITDATDLGSPEEQAERDEHTKLYSEGLELVRQIMQSGRELEMQSVLDRWNQRSGLDNAGLRQLVNDLKQR